MIHAARRTEAGIAFVRFTDYELDDITPIVKEFAFRVADTVSFNCVQTPPDRAALGFLVTRRSHDTTKPLESHNQFYRTEADVRRYLVRHMRKQPSKRVNLVAEADHCSLIALSAKWWLSICGGIWDYHIATCFY